AAFDVDARKGDEVLTVAEVDGGIPPDGETGDEDVVVPVGAGDGETLHRAGEEDVVGLGSTAQDDPDIAGDQKSVWVEGGNRRMKRRPTRRKTQRSTGEGDGDGRGDAGFECFDGGTAVAHYLKAVIQIRTP